MLAEPGTKVPIQLSTMDCDVHELFAWGALDPLPGYLSRRNLAQVRRSGQLADGTPWRWPWRLRSEAAVPEGSAITLLEPEGQRLGTVEVAECWAAENGHLISGAILLDAVPRTGAFQALRRPPDNAPRSGRVALAVDGPLEPAVVRGALREAAESGSPLLLMPLLGTEGTGVSPATVAAVRAVRASAELLGDEVEIAGLPLPPSWSRTPELRWLTAKAAHRFGAEVLLTGGPTVTASGDAMAAAVRRCPEGPDPDPALRSALEAVSAASRPPDDSAGLVVLLTGLPASGKSTLARGLRDWLTSSTSRTVTLLDGDIVRNTLSPDLSFSRADRLRNLTRLATVAAECARHGGVVVCAPVAPHEEGRELFRRTVTQVANFLLVHVATPVSECARRDPKGLYAAAAAGQLRGLTGVDDPYEVPFDPDVVVGAEPGENAVERVLDPLLQRGWVRRGAWEADG
ncbi:adenylyl-sulfate kinase [Saccharothrix sp. AJ9571]|nr:adenylyl-sulfate kinase [Saccharothrix sp. AJ9571]